MKKAAGHSSHSWLYKLLPSRSARTHRMARIWSNAKLAMYADRFTGSVVNVSAWKDVDKEGRRYRDYFSSASSYTITNYKPEFRGLQGFAHEIYLDLEEPLPSDLQARFDVVFNHTTLEHVYDFRTAFRNLCKMSKDVVIMVVPFVQQMHSTYGDYWRFSPVAVARLLEEEGLEVAELDFNRHRRTTVYVFAIGTKCPEKWRHTFSFAFSYRDDNAAHLREPYAGCNVLRPHPALEFVWGILDLFRRATASLCRFGRPSGKSASLR